MNMNKKSDIDKKRAKRQLEFCIKLMESLERSWQDNENSDKAWSRQPIANSTQIQADARRIRRELLLFIKILDER